MVYLKSFNLLNSSKEIGCLDGRTIHNNNYPLGIFSEKKLEKIYFDPITCFYGGNGSGKTTLLNIIADKIEATRNNYTKKGSIFDKYVELCDYEMVKFPTEIKFISSDDIFDYLLDIRAINSNVHRKKAELSEEWLENRFNTDNYNYNDYFKLKDVVDSKSKSMSKYIRERLSNNNIIEQSNGESALSYWEKNITENGIYILDEPENSLSAENQIKLKKYIEDSARFYNCQFIISTHSPFLLSLNDATVYNLDLEPASVQKYSELPNVRIYYDFFKEHEKDFE